MNSEIPLVCDMGVFTPDQREAHIRATTELMQVSLKVQEVENGYAFIFPNEADFISRITEFVSKERLCCAFLKFMLIVDSNHEPISLSLTGPLGTQEFLRVEFSEVFT